MASLRFLLVRGRRRAVWPVYAALIVLLFSIFGCGGEEEKPVSPGAKLDNLLKTGKLDEAERFLRELVKKEDSKKEKDSTQLHRGNLAQVLCLRGAAALNEAGFFDPDPKKAKKAKEHRSYAEALGFFKSAVSEARLVFKKLPPEKHRLFAEVRGTLGLALYRLGRLKEAIRELEADLESDPLFELSQNLPPEYGISGTVRLDPDTLETVPGSFEPATIIEVDLQESTEIEGDEPDVWGISFPKSMLPLGSDQGYWTSEPLLDLSGDEDEELVRVWLHAPAYKWPGKDEPNRQKGT